MEAAGVGHTMARLDGAVRRRKGYQPLHGCNSHHAREICARRGIQVYGDRWSATAHHSSYPAGEQERTAAAVSLFGLSSWELRNDSLNFYEILHGTISILHYPKFYSGRNSYYLDGNTPSLTTDMYSVGCSLV